MLDLMLDGCGSAGSDFVGAVHCDFISLAWEKIFPRLFCAVPESMFCGEFVSISSLTCPLTSDLHRGVEQVGK